MKKAILLMAIVFVFGFAACSNSAKPSVNGNTGTNSSTGTTAGSTAKDAANKSTEKTFTIDELKKYNGQNGNPAYVAVNGTVYDVTNAKGWQNGTHKNGITAGKDLTDAITSAPHGTDVLADLQVVGKLK
jgi:predicted heme/steroid binding protein